MSQRSARLCLMQLNPIAAWLGEGGAAITSNHISGAAVLEYGPTEISAPLQPIWTSKCASLPTAPPTQPPIPARLARLSTGDGWVCARHGLSAGGNRIRTPGPQQRVRTFGTARSGRHRGSKQPCSRSLSTIALPFPNQAGNRERGGRRSRYRRYARRPRATAPFSRAGR